MKTKGRMKAKKRVATVAKKAAPDLDAIKLQILEGIERDLAGWRQVSGGTDVQEETNIVNFGTQGGNWEFMGSAWKGHISSNQLVMLAQARHLFRFNPMARAAVVGMVKYVIGKGLTITPKSKDPKVWYVWRDFWTSPRNRMFERQFEIVKRYFRDGEVYIRYFNQTPGEVRSWKTTVRFLDPIDLRFAAEEKGADTDKTNQGIEYDPEDAETPVRYFFRNRLNPQNVDIMDASEIQRTRLPFTDMDQTRGESFLQPVMVYFTHYEQWLQNRIILNKLRTAIVMIREIEGTAANVTAMTQSLPSSSRAASGESKKVNIKPGTVYTAGPGVKLRMDAPNINASDVKDDGRNIILQICAGTGMPEYLYGDASNANYSSSMIAESPFVKEVYFHQSVLEAAFKEMFRRVMENAVLSGKLQAPPSEDPFSDNSTLAVSEAAACDCMKSKDGACDCIKSACDCMNSTCDCINLNCDCMKSEAAACDSDCEETIKETEEELFYGCDIQWPEIVHREPEKQAQALSTARTMGWISDKTASEIMGFDYEEEVRKQRQIEEDANGKGNPLMGAGQGDMALNAADAAGNDQMNAEYQDVLNNVSPALRQHLTKKGAPNATKSSDGQKKKEEPA